MNILFITHEMNMGGASKSLVTLASELQDRGHKVVVVLPAIKGKVYEALKEKNIHVNLAFYGWRVISEDWHPVFRIGFKVLYPFENLFAAYIVRIIKKHHIDIIHSNSSVIDVGVKAADMAGIPHVWHYREFQDFYHFHYIPNKQKRLAILKKTGGEVIFISHNLAEYYQDEIPLNIGKVIYNGVSTDFLVEKYESAVSAKKEKIVFLLAGNFHRTKKHDIAILAAKLLFEKGYRNFELLIAGAIANMADSAEYEKELRSMAKDMPDVVRFAGFVEDMVELRRQTDIEIVCSEMEAFGRVTVEAMMASNPVIASNTGANVELIKEKQNGRLFEKGDAADLAEKMQWFLDEPAKICECGGRAYVYAKENFLSDRNTENVIGVYRDILKKDTHL